jgi:hypothetical protein
MKKYTHYLVIVFLLALVSIYLLMSRGEGTYRKRDRAFAVADTSAVEFVEMSGYGAAVILSRVAAGWRVNGAFQAHPERIKGLMILLSRLEVSSPAPKSLKERIRAGFDTDGISVHIQLRDGHVRSYRVYHDTIGPGKTYMMMEGSDIPFAMRVRGYHEENLEGLFALDSRYWRDNTLIHLTPRQIKSVSLEHRQDPRATFHLDRNDSGSFLLARGILPDSWIEPDQEMLSQYLQYFSDVHFEEYAGPEELSSPDAAIGQEPVYRLKVLGLDLDLLTVDLYRMYFTDSEGALRMDPDRLIAGIASGREFVVMKYIEIDPVLKPYSYFLGD